MADVCAVVGDSTLVVVVSIEVAVESRVRVDDSAVVRGGAIGVKVVVGPPAGGATVGGSAVSVEESPDSLAGSLIVVARVGLITTGGD